MKQIRVKLIMMHKSLLIFLVTLLLFLNPALANAEIEKCSYKDYNYIPHPDQERFGLYRLTIRENPDLESDQNGRVVEEFYYLDRINPKNGEIYSTVKIPFKCTTSGILHCALDVKGKSRPEDISYVSVLENFSSGSMNHRAPFALSIPGFIYVTRNVPFAEENIIHWPEGGVYSVPHDSVPYFMPTIWVTDKVINNCIE